MKITKTQLRQIIKEELNEATQGEMEFAELEAARQNYKENPRDDEARHQFGMMVEKLVEPIMSEMGLFLEAEAFYNRGELVFTNYKNIDVTIDPLGMMGRYDVQVTPLAGSEGETNPMEISLDSMKGVAQFIKDEYRDQLSRGGTYKQPPRGMVGEPEDQLELPLENKNPREARMAEYGRIDAAAGRPPSKVGRRNPEYMEAYREEEEKQISAREQRFGDALDAMKENKMRITKSHLQKIIKEELKKENALMRNIDRWSEEGKDVPVGKTVGRAERSDQLDAILQHMSTDLGKAMDVVSYLVMNADQAVLDKWFEGRGLLGDPGA